LPGRFELEAVVFVRVANSPRLLFVVFIATIATSALVYDLVEDRASYLDSLYWAIVTATTLGYGDFSPETGTGKVLTSLLICFTVFLLIPTITANLASKLIVNRDAFTHDEQEEIKAALRRIEHTLEGDGSQTDHEGIAP